MLTLYFVLQEYRRFTGSEPAVARCYTRDQCLPYILSNRSIEDLQVQNQRLLGVIREISANPIFCLTGV